MSKSDDFLWQCRANYFIGIRPGDQNAKNLDGYKVLVEIAKEYFRDERYDAFIGFFQEGQYFIQLWAAHLLLEYGKPKPQIRAMSLKIIEEYSTTPLHPEVAIQEKAWLENFLKNNSP